MKIRQLLLCISTITAACGSGISSNTTDSAVTAIEDSDGGYITDSAERAPTDASVGTAMDSQETADLAPSIDFNSTVDSAISFDSSTLLDTAAVADSTSAIDSSLSSDLGSTDSSAMSGTQYGAIFSGVPWLDTAGNLVNAHGVGFLNVGATYYMVGEQRSGKNDTYSGAAINAEDTFTGVNMYSTTDFSSWSFVGTVVKPIAGTDVAPPYYGERPKILYNASTGKYVIYIKMLNYTGNLLVYTGYYAILTSSEIAGPYTYYGNLSDSSGTITGADDFEVFQDTDGTQYFVRSGGKLYKLASNGLSVASTVATSIQSGEGVSLYKVGNTYFWQSSQGSYWHSNDNSYSTATSLSGPWTAHGHFCPTGTDTWQSQDTAVVAVAGTSATTYVYIGDRWVDGDLPASTLVIQPFTISGSAESIATYNPIWNLNVSAGTWSAAAPPGASVNDNTTGSGPSQFDYSTGWTSNSCSGCYNGDKHSSNTTNATATIAFSGTQILLYSAYDDSSGIMGVTILDGNGSTVNSEVNVSLRYDAPATGNYMVYASPVLARGSYALKVRVTGTKDWYSGGTTCNVDRVLIVP